MFLFTSSTEHVYRISSHALMQQPSLFILNIQSISFIKNFRIPYIRSTKGKKLHLTKTIRERKRERERWRETDSHKIRKPEQSIDCIDIDTPTLDKRFRKFYRYIQSFRPLAKQCPSDIRTKNYIESKESPPPQQREWSS